MSACSLLLLHFMSATQLYLTLFHHMDYSLPGLSVHGVFQVRIQELVVKQVEGWQPRGYSGSACGSGAPTPTSPLPARQPCLPALSLCRGSHLTSLPSPSGWDLGAEPSGALGPMQCQLLWGLAGVLLTLLCMGLLSLRYHSSLSPQRVPKTPELSPPSPWPSELQLHDVFIVVKTTQAFHHCRQELQLNTWVSRTREQVTSGGLRVPGVAPGLSAHRGLSTTDLGFSGGPTGEAALLPALPGLCSRSSFLPGWGSPAAVSPSLAQEPGTPQAHCLVFWGPGYSGLLRPFWGSLQSLVALEQA